MFDKFRYDYDFDAHISFYASMASPIVLKLISQLLSTISGRDWTVEKGEVVRISSIEIKASYQKSSLNYIL